MFETDIKLIWNNFLKNNCKYRKYDLKYYSQSFKIKLINKLINKLKIIKQSKNLN